MLLETCDRIAPIISPDNTVVVLGEQHFKEATRLLAGRRIHLVAEPVGKNTAACIGLGTLYIGHLGYKGPIAFLPADHFIEDVPAFLNALEASAQLAEEGCIATIGIVPTRPDTGYGYIRRAQNPIHINEQLAFNAAEFIEKPDRLKAGEYLSKGNYYWNGGIFIARQDIIMQEIAEHLPALSSGLNKIEKAIETDAFDDILFEVYRDLPAISFDYGIMEKTRREVKVVECRCGWSDVGSWQSLYELRHKEHDRDGNLKEGDPIVVECRQSFISARGRKKIACLGLESCLVIDTPDALLVADIHRSQEIRKIVEKLDKLGEDSLL